MSRASPCPSWLRARALPMLSHLLISIGASYWQLHSKPNSWSIPTL